MRPLFFALMIALLLLRGWVGDAMANGMALAPLQHSQPSIMAMQMSMLTTPDAASMTTAAQTAHKAEHDCAGHASTDDDSPAASTHCQSCDACQACHSVALIPPAISAGAAFDLRIQPPAKATRFASAEAAPGQKPPIS